MPAFYSSTVSEFLQLSNGELTGLLTIRYAQAGFTAQKTSQTRAWLSDLENLRSSLDHVREAFPEALFWTIALEFEIPRKEKRIDVVLLAGDVIVILELKSGLLGAEAFRQAEEYALLLHFFHRPSDRRKIFTFVVSAKSSTKARSLQIFLPLPEAPAFWISPTEQTTWDELAVHLLQITARVSSAAIDPEDWLNGEYHLVPTIIDAARSLEAGLKTVREIAHSRAARHDVDELTSFVDRLIERAKREEQHIICFVTGVPGSGKTLVGLNLAFAHREDREPIHFMSGTGPLVKVLQTVLARSKRKRERMTTKRALIDAKALLENVHVFAREYSEHDTQRPPNNHVIIFDEAQRAWNREQNLSKFKRDYSEPEMLLRIMERHQDWAVVIALVGGGQEINSGEAGLGAWGNALLHNTAKRWDIFASPEAINGGAAVEGSKLFETDHQPANAIVEAKLHLDVGVRSLKADSYSDWVNHVVNGDSVAAATLEIQHQFPILLTRSLEEARRALRENTRGESRCGLVGSSKATRLRSEGLEPDGDFHKNYPWEHWYLAKPSDTRSSYQLEVFTTEFEIQGLELDWVGMCWGGDYIWSASSQSWDSRTFNVISSKWSPIKQNEKRLYRKNSYRVLLTRARQGIVIFVPRGNANDPTISPEEFDETADFLLSCGARLLTHETESNI